MRVEGQLAVVVEVPLASQLAGAGARRQTDLFEQDRERDGEAVVDGSVLHLPQRDTGSLLGAGSGRPGAELRQAGRGGDVLVRVSLARARDPHAEPVGGLLAHHEGRAPVRNRTAVEQLERRRDGLGRQHRLDADRLLELRAGMHEGVPAHQHGQLCEIRLRGAVLVHVARGDEPVVGRNRRPERHLVHGAAHLRERLHGGIAALAGQPVLSGHHQDVARGARGHQVVRQHRHAEPRRAAELHRMRVGRVQPVVLAKTVDSIRCGNVVE